MIYVANGTAQRHNLAYRVPGETRIRYVFIEPGKQVEIGHDLPPEDAEAVIVHLERYGVRRVHDLASLGASFAGIVYSTSKPVKPDRILEANDENTTNTSTRSLEQLKQAATVMDARTRDSRSRRRRAKSSELRITSVSPSNTESHKPIDVTLTVGD